MWLIFIAIAVFVIVSIINSYTKYQETKKAIKEKELLEQLELQEKVKSSKSEFKSNNDEFNKDNFDDDSLDEEISPEKCVSIIHLTVFKKFVELINLHLDIFKLDKKQISNLMPLLYELYLSQLLALSVVDEECEKFGEIVNPLVDGLNEIPYSILSERYMRIVEKNQSYDVEKEYKVNFLKEEKFENVYNSLKIAIKYSPINGFIKPKNFIIYMCNKIYLIIKTKDTSNFNYPINYSTLSNEEVYAIILFCIDCWTYINSFCNEIISDYL